METYLKHKQGNWFSYNVTTIKSGYPIEKKNKKNDLDKLEKEFKPKLKKESIGDDIIQLLDSSIKFDFTNIELIDITAHVNDGKVFGIINYIEDKSHKQFRF